MSTFCIQAGHKKEINLKNPMYHYAAPSPLKNIRKKKHTGRQPKKRKKKHEREADVMKNKQKQSGLKQSKKRDKHKVGKLTNTTQKPRKAE